MDISNNNQILRGVASNILSDNNGNPCLFFLVDTPHKWLRIGMSTPDNSIFGYASIYGLNAPQNPNYWNSLNPNNQIYLNAQWLFVPNKYKAYKIDLSNIINPGSGVDINNVTWDITAVVNNPLEDDYLETAQNNSNSINQQLQQLSSNYNIGFKKMCDSYTSGAGVVKRGVSPLTGNDFFIGYDIVNPNAQEIIVDFGYYNANGTIAIKAFSIGVNGKGSKNLILDKGYFYQNYIGANYTNITNNDGSGTAITNVRINSFYQGS